MEKKKEERGKEKWKKGGKGRKKNKLQDSPYRFHYSRQDILKYFYGGGGGKN